MEAMGPCPTSLGLVKFQKVRKQHLLLCWHAVLVVCVWRGGDHLQTQITGKQLVLMGHQKLKSPNPTCQKLESVFEQGRCSHKAGGGGDQELLTKCRSEPSCCCWPHAIAAPHERGFRGLVEGKGKGKVLGRSPNSSVSVIPTCPSQHPFRLAGSQTP